MTLQKKLWFFTFLSFSFFSFNLFFIQKAYSVTSTIEIARTPYLTFLDVPDSFSFGNIETSSYDTEITSDEGPILEPRYLIVKDTRGCGGLIVQAEANNFIPMTNPLLRDNLRTVTSSRNDVDRGIVNGLKYLGLDGISGFIGDQTAVAPLDVETIDFTDPAVFTNIPFDNGMNILNQPIDIIQGSLNAPNGRIGRLHLGMAFYLKVPKYMPPGTYASTLTFTLTDSTIGNCSPAS